MWVLVYLGYRTLLCVGIYNGKTLGIAGTCVWVYGANKAYMCGYIRHRKQVLDTHTTYNHRCEV